MDIEKKGSAEEEIEETEEETEGGEDKGGNPESGKKEKDSKGGDKTFTQSQVTRMMTREKNQGRNSVYNELGINPKDTKMIKMFKAFVESQKAGESDEGGSGENDTKIAEAENRAVVAEAKAESMMQGVNKKYVEDIVTLALAKLSDDSDLKTIIGELKTKYPTWFDNSEEDEGNKDKGKGKTGQKGTGSSIKNSEKENKDGKEKGLGARLAAQRKNGLKKTSYWGGNK